MGLMDRFLGAGAAVTTVTNAATGMAEVFRENATRRMELDEEAYARAIAQLSGEFAAQPRGWFDGLMNGLNRMPRPLMTMGTLGLFAYAMVDPQGFGLRMENVNLVPEPLWWLLGAIISFYFGAREAHYFRARPMFRSPSSTGPADPVQAAFQPLAATDPFQDNAALRDWAATTGGN
ncbi:holin family protein [Paracoccus sp. (in: a-proteobacteria)]|uniref:holin family protein n=1 Tax=Paracoccus sp. TaxID=267 RepID=UPI0028AC80C0|nr:holin family protein [Paracoccus sp. (in: a-proteobacteria)]